MKQIIHWIKNVEESTIYKTFINWSKKYALPGFRGLPIYFVAMFFFNELKKESLSTKASSLAYSFMLAIFPAIIFLFTLIPYIPVEGVQDELLSILKDLLPYNAYIAAESTLINIIKIQNGGLLSVGFLAAMFFSTNGTISLIQAFNKVSLINEKRSFLEQRKWALFLTLMIVFILILGISIIITGELIFEYLKNQEIITGMFLYIFQIFKWLMITFQALVSISILYYYGPAVKRKKKFFSPGSISASLLSIVTSVGFSYYINNFGTYNKVYGSIGTLIVIMVFLYINSFILLIGYELDASIELAGRSFSEKDEEYGEEIEYDL